MVKTKDMGLYLPDGCHLFDDEEVTGKEIVGENCYLRMKILLH